MLEGREWRTKTGASTEDIEALTDIVPIRLPQELLDFLRFSNGGEGPLAVQPLWFVLYPAEEIVEIERSGTFKEFFEGLFVFGGSGGGDAVAIDLRQHPQSKIVSFDMTNIDLDESVLEVAPDFPSFLALVGVPEIAE